MKILLLLIIAIFSSCGNKKHIKLTISSAKSILTAPVWIAENRQFFKKEGIDIQINEYNSGKASFKAMLDGFTGISTVAQTPVVFTSFERDDFYIFATMVTSYNDLKILVNKDLKIKEPEDLRDKKVGLTQGSSGQYFMDLFLIYHGIQKDEVQILNYAPPELQAALADNEVDVIVTWEPHILKAKKLLGNKVEVLPSNGIYREDFYLSVRKDLVKNDPEVIEKFLKAMVRAAEYISNNRDKSIAIVSGRLNLDKSQTEEVWDSFDYQIILDQSTLSSLEDEARWSVREGFVEGEIMPNFLDFIYTEALEKVDSNAVSIVH